MEKPIDLNSIEASAKSPRIHILGIGNIGSLVAHSIGRLPNRPPITLLFHRPSLVQDFLKARGNIEITTNGISQKVGGFEYEVVGAPSNHKERGSDTMIQNLIIATKATHTISALSNIRHRLNADSTIIFAQNGMGTTEEVSKALFPVPAYRPAYLTSVVYHGIYSTGPFASIHAGVGFINISDPSLAPSPYPGPVAKPGQHQHQHLLNIFISAPAINAIAVSPSELLLIQLEKLVVNTIINPLTALFRIRNGELYDYPELQPLIHALIDETRAVILAYLGVQLPMGSVGSEHVNAKSRFGTQELRTLVKEKALLTKENRSSMLVDVEEGRGTEIEFINGWIVTKGRELGVSVDTSERVVQGVIEGRVLGFEEVGMLLGHEK